MVFSFFKKQPQKMPERTAARPRAPLPEMKLNPPVEEAPVSLEPLPDLEFSVDKPAPAVAGSAPAKPVAAAVPQRKIDVAMAIDDFDNDFTESSVMAIDVEHDVDPLQADVEQVAVLFANGQDDAARSILESLLRAYPEDEGIRLWRLLFDLLQILGDRAAFDRYGLEFAERFELSPPAWRAEQCLQALPAEGGQAFALQGVLTADDCRQVQQLTQLLAQAGELRLDFSRLAGCDDLVAGMLAEALIDARRRGKALALTGVDALIKRLDERLKVGDAAHEPSWRLLLELLQRHGTQEHFEERAVDYAVTFELSPPSWEPQRVAGKNKPTKAEAETARGAEIHYLSGDLKSERFEDMLPLLEGSDQPVIDFSCVRRVDFYSAGQLVNRLAPFKAAGKEIVIRSPNHLVAELMAVVGLNKQARIIVPKS
jgi:anti-anti-sigma regulatory factor